VRPCVGRTPYDLSGHAEELVQLAVVKAEVKMTEILDARLELAKPLFECRRFPAAAAEQLGDRDGVPLLLDLGQAVVADDRHLSLAEQPDQRSALAIAYGMELRTIAGMTATALAVTEGSESRQPMAVAVIGGMLTLTLLSLFLVPVIYEIIDDAEAAARRRSLAGRAGAGACPLTRQPPAIASSVAETSRRRSGSRVTSSIALRLWRAAATS
jgi:hypothetical protein